MKNHTHRHSREDTTTREIQPINEPDLMDIPLTSNDYLEQAQHIPPNDLEILLNPSTQDKTLSEFMAWHERLNHLNFKNLFSLS